ncbi:MAG TPA: HIT family protein [Saprospiraceae bacterium]|nr:HIT family protein [Saprospiraceae bacterium]HMV23880.1 HIT family protein [Saprospiraceae bacterium]HMW74159.1 HIT family protein [Saprospiraceae bacterium]HMX82420.1 HIT family protein [Saprospiraceae bacterium]HMX85289.1 HIT family protein [Saprospiraceae bacterium]
MSTIFSKIISGEIPCFKVAEDEQHLAFLDINPVAFGHTLVIPKREIDYYFDLDDEEIARLMIFSKKVALALKSVVPCTKIGISVIGLEVPHTHVHLVPINAIADMTFGKKIEISIDELTKLASQLADKIKIS